MKTSGQQCGVVESQVVYDAIAWIAAQAFRRSSRRDGFNFRSS